ncbi:MAG: hypothetical protein VKL97_00050 [Cyanobacteriota bacterium]|nr:hypothetical protein [Cyanobacteriota bacterium]
MNPQRDSRSEQEDYKPLHPLPKGLVELYGFLAVLVVLIPEWMASGALQQLIAQPGRDSLPAQTRAWRRLPELRLASMSLAELRLMARQLRLGGYSGLGRDRLSARLLQRIRRRKELW